MSFILDALKKSDTKRQQGEVPNLQTHHGAPTEPPGRQKTWMVWIAVALFLNACLLLWWLRPWQDTGTGHEPLLVEAPEAGNASPSPAPTAQQLQPLRPPSVGEVESRPRRPRAAEPVPSESRPAPKTLAAAVQTAAPDTSAMPLTVSLPEDVPQSPPSASAPPSVKPVKTVTEPVESAAPALPTVESDPEVRSLYQMPASIRNRVPEMAMSLHFYTEAPEARMVRINNQILREGQTVAGGPEILEITPDGVIFSQQGRIFTVDELKVDTGN